MHISFLKHKKCILILLVMSFILLRLIYLDYQYRLSSLQIRPFDIAEISSLENSDEYVEIMQKLNNNEYKIESFLTDSYGNKKGIIAEKSRDIDYESVYALSIVNKNSHFYSKKYSQLNRRHYTKYIANTKVEITYFFFPSEKAGDSVNSPSFFITFDTVLDNKLILESFLSTTNYEITFQSLNDVPQTLDKDVEERIEKFLKTFQF